MAPETRGAAKLVPSTVVNWLPWTVEVRPWPGAARSVALAPPSRCALATKWSVLSVAVTLMVSPRMAVNPSPAVPLKLLPVAVTTGIFSRARLWISSVMRWPMPPSCANQSLV